MKKGYDIILSLRYTTTLKIESDKEDEEEIKEDARQGFIQDVLDVTGARNLLERYLKVVGLERNWSESDMELMPWEVEKPYMVEYSVRYEGVSVTVMADCEEDAIDRADEKMTTCFISEDGLTECEVDEYEYYDTWDIEARKKADEAAMNREHQRIDEVLKCEMK